jgi:hypothetical protein
MQKIDDGGCAFPNVPADPQYTKWEEGMSLRDAMAINCPMTMEEFLKVYGRSEMQDLFGGGLYDHERREFLKMFAQFRYEYADAMIAEKRRTEGGVS